MNNNVDSKEENTYAFSRKTEDWKLSSRKLGQSVCKQEIVVVQRVSAEARVLKEKASRRKEVRRETVEERSS